MPAPVWVPSDLGANLPDWWKADIMANPDGSAVAVWPDSSGNGRHLTEGANTPTFETNEINGLPVVRFDGVSQRLAVADTGITAAPWSFACVVKMATAAGALLHNAASVLVARTGGQWTFLASNAVNIAADASVTDYRVLTGIVNGASSIGSFNGTPCPTGDAGTTALASAQIGPAFVAGVFNGDLPELFLGDTAWDEATRQNAEGYLAWKYGLQAELPGDHPYAAGGVRRTGLRYPLGSGLRQRTLRP